MSKVQFDAQSPRADAAPSFQSTLPPRSADAGALSPRGYGDVYGLGFGPSFPSERSVTERDPSPARAASEEPPDESSPLGSPDVSIILASLNERENLPRLIEMIRGLNIGTYELLVVDDGSTDGTRQFVLSMARGDPRIRPIFNDSRQTLTIAHLQGILASRGRYVIVMDSDLQHPPEAVPRLLRRLQDGADLVVGSRYLPGGSVGSRTAFRGLMSRVASRLARSVLTETRAVSDPISGFFGFRRAVFRPFDVRYRGYETILFMLVMCEGRPIAEIGYEFQSRSSGDSKITQDFGFIPMFLRQLMLAYRFRLTLRRGRPAASGGTFPVSSPAKVGVVEAEASAPSRMGGLLNGPT